MPDRVHTSLHASGWRVASVKGHTVLGSGYLLDAGKNLIVYRGKPTPESVRKGKRPEIFKYRLISRARPRMRIDRATWICRPNAVNYFHWLIETVPKLYFLRHVGWKEPIIVGNQILEKEWVKETLSLFPDLKFMAVPYYKEIKVKTLFLVDEGDVASWEMKKELNLRNAAMLKEMKEFLLASLKVEPTGMRSRRIHLSRQKDKRKIANIDAVRPVLGKFGFEEIYMQDFPLGTQFALMANAEVVFAPHGAGLANVLFMPETGKVLEVKHIRKFQQDSVFPGLSHSLGLSHYVLESECDGGRNDDFFVNPSMLEAKLAEMMGVHH